MIRLVKIYKSVKERRVIKQNRLKKRQVSPRKSRGFSLVSDDERVEQSRNIVMEGPQRFDSLQQIDTLTNIVPPTIGPVGGQRKSIFSINSGSKGENIATGVNNIRQERNSILLNTSQLSEIEKQRPDLGGTIGNNEDSSDLNRMEKGKNLKPVAKGRKSLLRNIAGGRDFPSNRSLMENQDRIEESELEIESPARRPSRRVAPENNPSSHELQSVLHQDSKQLDNSRVNNNNNEETENDEKPGEDLSDIGRNDDNKIETEEEEQEKPIDEATQESRVGKRLSELTTKRVIIIVLILIFVIPLFSSDYYFDSDLSYTYHMNVFRRMTNESNKVEALMKHYVDFNQRQVYPIVYVSIPKLGVNYSSMDPMELRTDEKEIYNEFFGGNESDENSLLSIIDLRYKTRWVAGLNILRTIYVCVVLTVGSLLFSMDANELALRPIERMIEKVNKIASNPLASREAGVKLDKMNYETTLIENAIVKIGVLLALGFGDAGSEIIAQNLAHGGDVDAMLPGKRKWAVFGFCDIRSFTDATEVLQQDVMVFVNTIAELVHRTVDKHGGAANKNIGDAFLLVWKLPEDDTEKDENGMERLKRTKTVKNICDLSLISFLKIISGINKKPNLLRYREHEGLNQRMPNFKIKMGFGLHVGWAIEGAIGSDYKIDASYLSPNVNMASRLEAATKQYGVPLLFSNSLFENLSKTTQRFCRPLDRVTVKGSKTPIGLYSVDLDLEGIPIGKNNNFYSKEERKFRHKVAKTELMDQVYSGQVKVSALFVYDKDLVYMTRNKNLEIEEIWNQVYDGYISGDWSLGKAKLEEYMNLRPEDGPSATILSIFKEHQFMAPADWPGYRELTEK
jgi:class 3 adenylate cyclase